MLAAMRAPTGAVELCELIGLAQVVERGEGDGAERVLRHRLKCGQRGGSETEGVRLTEVNI